MFSSGTSVYLHGLRQHPHLNDRRAVILRAANPPDDIRCAVYVHATNTHSSTVVRVRHENICIDSYNNNNAASATGAYHPPPPPPPRPIFRPNWQVRDVLPGTNHTPILYAFGNTAPVYALLGVKPEAPSAAILLLASGDLRSALYSIAREQTGRRSSSQHLSFTLNDSCATVIARNVLILWLLLQPAVATVDILSIWFSLGLDSRAYAALCDGVHALTGATALSVFRNMGVTFHTPRDRIVVQRVMAHWLSWQDALEWSHVQKLRHDAIEQSMHYKLEAIQTNRSEVQIEKYRSPLDMNFPIEAAKREMRNFVASGALMQDGSFPKFTNPTLFLSSDVYSLHYGSSPFDAFPSFSDNYDDTRPLYTLCLQSLMEWRSKLTARHGVRKLSWIFSTSDCVRLAVELHGPYDVIATSNVSDPVGLLPLLQALRTPLIASTGVLLTQTLRYRSYSTSPREYLQANLRIPIERTPTLLGWRCRGHEGSLAPSEGDVQFVMPSISDAMLSATTNIDGKCHTRAELNFVWTPVSDGELPLQLISDEHFRKLIHTLCVQSPSFFQGGARFAIPTRYSPIAPASMLRTLCHAVDADIVLSDGGVVLTEVRDVVRAVQQKQLDDLEIASVNVEQRLVRRAFCAELPIFGHMALTVVLVDGEKNVPYFSVEMDYDDIAGVWRLSWVWRRESVPLGCRVIVQSRINEVASFQSDEIERHPLNVNEVPRWMHYFVRKERRHDCSVTDCLERWSARVCVPTNWREIAELPARLKSEVQKDGLTVIVSVGSEKMHELCLPFVGPVRTVERCELSIDQQVVEVRALKGRYDIQGVGQPEVWIHDTGACASMSGVADTFLHMVSELYMSENEKFISRSRASADCPPTVALKAALIALLKKRGTPMWALYALDAINRVPDVQVVGFSHSVRREHRHGTPVIDVSFCVLDEENEHIVLPWTQRQGNPVNYIDLPEDGIALFKQYFGMLLGRCKDGVNGGDRNVRENGLDKKVRKWFTRLLVPPLLSSEAVNAFYSVTARIPTKGRPTNVGSLSSEDKRLGVALVKEGKNTEALKAFKSGVIRMDREGIGARHLCNQAHNSANGGSEGERRLLATCYLNIAHCLLMLVDGSTDSDAHEVVVCCNAALQQLRSISTGRADVRLLSKAHYRKGRALERLGRRNEAKSELETANAHLQDDAISDALQRLQQN